MIIPLFGGKEKKKNERSGDGRLFDHKFITFPSQEAYFAAGLAEA